MVFAWAPCEPLQALGAALLERKASLPCESSPCKLCFGTYCCTYGRLQGSRFCKLDVETNFWFFAVAGEGAKLLLHTEKVRLED